MEPISKELAKVLEKVGPVGGSHIHISGRPYGVHVDITPDDLQVIIDEIGKIPMLTNRDNPNIHVTNLELTRTVFGNPEITNRFMFCCCLLQNGFGSAIFTIKPEGNYDRINYQGEMKNIVIKKAAKAVKEATPAKVEPAKEEKPRGRPRKISATGTIKVEETKPISTRKKRK